MCPHVCAFVHVLTHDISFLQVVYAAALVGMSLYGLKHPNDLPSYRLVAYFAMLHVIIWAIVGVFDRSEFKLTERDG